MCRAKCIPPARSSCHREDEPILGGGERSDRQPIASAEHEEILQRVAGMESQRLECDWLRKPARELHVHRVPSRRLRVARRVVMAVGKAVRYAVVIGALGGTFT